MSHKLRINNLSEDTTVEDLRTLFSQVGTIARAKISREKETGLSKGYGFVEMDTDDSARSAITALNKHHLKGREIRVGKVRPRSGSRQPGSPRRPKRT